MCGIAGFTHQQSKNSRPLLTRMVGTLRHRGPDDEAFYVSDKIAFGMRRLSIIDLTPGIYPIKNERGNLILIFNGEIYNFGEIKRELEKFGHRFKTKCDGEVLVHAYEQWGENFLSRLNGMFALALWNKKEKRLFLARDRLGIKPLYYALLGGDLVFASEIKAILKHPEFKKKPNLKVLGSYFSFRYIVGEETFFEKIYSLPPGYFLVWQEGKVKKKRYWDLPIIADKKGEDLEFYLEKTKLLLKKSVKRRLISDVPLGAFLSGGLDSSIIVAIMSNYSNRPVKTFSIGFAEKGFNELTYSRRIAKRFKTDHQEIILKGVDYIDLMSKLIKFKDAPLAVPNEVPLYLMSKELKKIFTVVLSGEGADELFGGYGRIFRSPFDYQRLKLIPTSARERFLPNLYRKYKGFDPENELEFFLYLYRYTPLKEQREIFSSQVNEIVKNDQYGIAVFQSFFQKTKDLSFYERVLYVFQKLHLLGLLHKIDTTTMAASVEGRVPFVDHELVEFVNGIPFGDKIPWKSLTDKLVSLFLNCNQISEKHDVPKFLLKKNFEGILPKRIVWRKKVGFPVPLDDWFKGSFKDYARKILLGSKSKSRGLFNLKNVEKMIRTDSGEKFGLKLWQMVNLELWFREYID